MGRRGLRAAAVCGVLFGLLAGSAHAGTLSIEENTTTPARNYLRFTASPGEANNLKVEHGVQYSIRVRDDGARITLPRLTRGTITCVRQLDGWVECRDAVQPQNATGPLSFPPLTQIDLGDQADLATLGIPAITQAGSGSDVLAVSDGNTVHGGDGNDAITSANRLTAYGDAGDDTFHTGFFANIIQGGDGNDTQYVETHAYPADPWMSVHYNRFDGGSGDDRQVDLHRGGGRFDFTGGPGADSFVADDTLLDDDSMFWSYDDGRTAGVKVVPDGLANDGAKDEGDNVPTTIQMNLKGSHFDDDLTESPTPGSVDGLGGNDTLRGGHPANTSFNGMGGNDRILAADGARDSVRCGEGSDQVVADLVDDIGFQTECEKISFG